MELIAYEGEKFSIEWYFDLNSKSDALEYFNELPQEFQERALKRKEDYETRTKKEQYY